MGVDEAIEVLVRLVVVYFDKPVEFEADAAVTCDPESHRDRPGVPVENARHTRSADSVHARPWGLGTNTGDLDALLEQTQDSVRRLAEQTGRAVNIVGWSLGGVYARETARDHPDTVHRIATLGTPLLGPCYTLGRTAYPEAELRRIEVLIDERRQRPIKVPLKAIYSRNDGIVDWRTCPDRDTAGAVNVEVSSSHTGMGLDPTVWMHLARWLSA